MYMCVPSSSGTVWNCGSLEHVLLWSLIQDWIWSLRFWSVVWAGILMSHWWHTMKDPQGNTFSIFSAAFWQMGHTTSSSKLFCSISENISSSLAINASYSAIISSSGKVNSRVIYSTTNTYTRMLYSYNVLCASIVPFNF
jgi:hypothetical protein